MQFRTNQEVEAKKQEKTNSAILLRDGTVPELPMKPELLKRKEYNCRNCYLNVLAKRHKVKISTDRSFPENPMQYRPNQEVEAERQKPFKDQSWLHIFKTYAFYK